LIVAIEIALPLGERDGLPDRGDPVPHTDPLASRADLLPLFSG
jgi:hypothetical protein